MKRNLMFFFPFFTAWTKVTREYTEQTFSESGRNPTVTYYQEREPNPLLKGMLIEVN